MKFSMAYWRGAAALATGGFGALLAAAYTALILAEFGVFRLWPCLVAAAIAGAGVATASWGAHPATAPVSARIGWAVAGLIALGSLTLTLPPGETILGGWDPGVYVHTGAAVSREGSLQIPADDIARLPNRVRADLTRRIAGFPKPFLGMFPLPDGRLSPQFMHLYPSLLAVGHALAGVRGALLVNPILNVFALLALYGLASKIVGHGWAVGATLLLALHPAQIWQARFSTAEMLTQTLLSAACWAYILFMRREAPVRHALISGGLFGLAFFARYDTILLLVPLFLLTMVLKNAPGERALTGAFLLALSLPCAHAAWHMIRIAPYYRPLSDRVLPVLVPAFIVGIALFVALRFRAPRRAFEALLARPRLLRASVSVFALLFLIFVWYVRPRLTLDGRVARVATLALEAAGRPEWLRTMADENAFNMRYGLALFGLFGLLLALAGLLALVWRANDRGVMAWLLAAGAVAAFLLVHLHHDHFMMWASRRFVPVAIPLLAIGSAAAAREIREQARGRFRTPAAFLSVGVLAAALLTNAPKTWAMAATRDWPGLVGWTSRVAHAVPEQAVVFCDQPGFAAPFRFLYGLRAHEVYGGMAASEFVRRHRRFLTEPDGNLYILSMREQPDGPGLALREVGAFELTSSVQNHPRYAVPRQVRPCGGLFRLYKVVFEERATKVGAEPRSAEKRSADDG